MVGVITELLTSPLQKYDLLKVQVMVFSAKEVSFNWYGQGVLHLADFSVVQTLLLCTPRNPERALCLHYSLCSGLEPPRCACV